VSSGQLIGNRSEGGLTPGRDLAVAHAFDPHTHDRRLGRAEQLFQIGVRPHHAEEPLLGAFPRHGLERPLLKTSVVFECVDERNERKRRTPASAVQTHLAKSHGHGERHGRWRAVQIDGDAFLRLTKQDPLHDFEVAASDDLGLLLAWGWGDMKARLFASEGNVCDGRSPRRQLAPDLPEQRARVNGRVQIEGSFFCAGVARCETVHAKLPLMFG
jgi:hypothetical protein